MAGTMGLQAQKVEIGFRYMPTLSKFDVVTADNGKADEANIDRYAFITSYANSVDNTN